MSGRTPKKPTTPAKLGEPKKPAQKPVRRGLPSHLVPGNPGNSGGKPGRSGRKPNAFVAECEAMADALVLPKLRKKLEESDASDTAWQWAATRVLEYSKSKAPTVSQSDVTVRAGVVVLPAPEAPIAIVESEHAG